MIDPSPSPGNFLCTAWALADFEQKLSGQWTE